MRWVPGLFVIDEREKRLRRRAARGRGASHAEREEAFVPAALSLLLRAFLPARRHPSTARPRTVALKHSSRP
jgi:hypothetical protein